MKEFKIRCSAIGQIMTNSRSKSETLSKTTMSYCQDWLKEQLYARRKEFTSKYTDKGTIVEDNALDLIAETQGYGMLIKNEEHFENDYITGTPDVVLRYEIIDNKSSWDCFTFPLFETQIDKGYEYQLQGYMGLTGRKKAKLIYTLMDTPLNIIEKEAYYYCKNQGFDELDQDIYNEFINKHTYSQIDPKYRVKVFEIDFNPDVFKAIEDRVIECRKYIETLI